MRRFLLFVSLSTAIAIGGWLLYHRSEIHQPGDVLRLAGQQLQRWGGTSAEFAGWRQRQTGLIRIASFNARNLNAEKTSDPRVGPLLADIIRQFDVVAVQEVDTADRFLLKRFLKEVNRTGRQFRYVMSQRPDRNSPPQQSAIFYDSSAVALDHLQYYNVNDPDNLVKREPLVAWFRTLAGDKSFTFTLVNVQLEPQSGTNEMSQINQIFRAVRNDGRNEDDVILAGCFGVDSAKLDQLAIAQGLQAVNREHATNTQSSSQFDNLMIDPLATSEFTGDTGVFDFLKQYNLTLAEALVISSHLPVWAEFTVHETGAHEQVAGSRNTLPLAHSR